MDSLLSVLCTVTFMKIALARVSVENSFSYICQLGKTYGDMACFWKVKVR